MNKKNILSIIALFGIALSFNGMAMLSRLSRVRRQYTPSKQVFAPTAVEQAPSARSYSSSAMPEGNQGGWWESLQKGWNNLASFFQQPRIQNYKKELISTVEPTVRRMAESSAVRKMAKFSVVQKGVVFLEQRARNVIIEAALLSIEELRKHVSEIGKVYFTAEGKLESWGEGWKFIHDVCKQLTGNAYIPRFSFYDPSHKIRDALNQRLPNDRTILGHFLENLIMTIQDGGKEILNEFEFDKIYREKLEKSFELKGYNSASTEMDSLLAMGAELSTSDIVVLQGLFAEWVNRIGNNSVNGKVYDIALLAKLCRSLASESLTQIFFDTIGGWDAISYSFKSNGDVYEIDGAKLRRVLSLVNGNMLTKKISDLGVINAKLYTIIHLTQSDMDERDLKEAIMGLFKINGKNVIAFPSRYARPEREVDL